jgi:hypothetical protein
MVKPSLITSLLRHLQTGTGQLKAIRHDLAYNDEGHGTTGLPIVPKVIPYSCKEKLANIGPILDQDKNIGPMS